MRVIHELTSMGRVRVWRRTRASSLLLLATLSALALFALFALLAASPRARKVAAPQLLHHRGGPRVPLLLLLAQRHHLGADARLLLAPRLLLHLLRVPLREVVQLDEVLGALRVERLVLLLELLEVGLVPLHPVARVLLQRDHLALEELLALPVGEHLDLQLLAHLPDLLVQLARRLVVDTVERLQPRARLLLQVFGLNGALGAHLLQLLLSRSALAPLP